MCSGRMTLKRYDLSSFEQSHSHFMEHNVQLYKRHHEKHNSLYCKFCSAMQCVSINLFAF